MGWGSGQNAQGREVGYTVEATCDEPDCTEQIDRGLAYCCGGMHDGDEHGCGEYFCGSHLFFVDVPEPHQGGRDYAQLCKRCSDQAEWLIANPGKDSWDYYDMRKAAHSA